MFTSVIAKPKSSATVSNSLQIYFPHNFKSPHFENKYRYIRYICTDDAESRYI